MVERFISRGFRGRREPSELTGRIAPGQHLERGFPVLSAGPTPHTPLDRWDFSIVGKVEQPRHWTWDELHAVAQEQVTADIHCVTKWSKLDTHWQAVSVQTLLEQGNSPESPNYVFPFTNGVYPPTPPL